MYKLISLLRVLHIIAVLCAQLSENLYTKNHMEKQEIGRDHSRETGRYTIGLLLRTQLHAVQEAVTDHITLTEVICFNSLPIA